MTNDGSQNATKEESANLYGPIIVDHVEQLSSLACPCVLLSDLDPRIRNNHVNLLEFNIVVLIVQCCDRIVDSYDNTLPNLILCQAGKVFALTG